MVYTGASGARFHHVEIVDTSLSEKCISARPQQVIDEDAMQAARPELTSAALLAIRTSSVDSVVGHAQPAAVSAAAKANRRRSVIKAGEGPVYMSSSATTTNFAASKSKGPQEGNQPPPSQSAKLRSAFHAAGVPEAQVHALQVDADDPGAAEIGSI